MNLNLSGKIAVIVWAAASFGMISCMTASAAGPVIGIDAAGCTVSDEPSTTTRSDADASRIAPLNAASGSASPKNVMSGL